MKRFTTIIACIAFAIFGIGLARYAEQQGVGPPSNALYANEHILDFNVPKGVYPSVQFGNLQKEQQSLSFTETSTPVNSDSMLIDSLLTENTKLTAEVCSLKEQRLVNNVEGRGSPAPKPVVKFRTVYKTIRDTITLKDTVKEQVYLATQSGKENPDGCIPVYELKHVRDICPGTSQSEGDVIAHPNSADE